METRGDDETYGQAGKRNTQTHLPHYIHTHTPQTAGGGDKLRFKLKGGSIPLPRARRGTRGHSQHKRNNGKNDMQSVRADEPHTPHCRVREHVRYVLRGIGGKGVQGLGQKHNQSNSMRREGVAIVNRAARRNTTGTTGRHFTNQLHRPRALNGPESLYRYDNPKAAHNDSDERPGEHEDEAGIHLHRSRIV